MTIYPQHRLHIHRPHLSPWLVAVIALAAALVGLASWVIVDKTTSSSGTATTAVEGQASPQVVKMLNARIAAFNAGRSVASFYTPNAVLDDREASLVTRGNQEIGSLLQGYRGMGMRMHEAGPVIQFGRTVAQAVNAAPVEPQTGWMLVYRLAANGKIAYQWVLPTSSP